MRSFIGGKRAKELYITLIHPHLLYADVIYDGGGTTGEQTLQAHQNAALHAIKNDNRYSATALHNQQEIDWFDTQRINCCCIKSFEGLNNLSSGRVNNLHVETTNLRTLGSDSVVRFSARNTITKFGDRNVPLLCEYYWKTLLSKVKNLDKLATFKSALSTGCYFNHQ